MQGQAAQSQLRLCRSKGALLARILNVPTDFLFLQGYKDIHITRMWPRRMRVHIVRSAAGPYRRGEDESEKLGLDPSAGFHFNSARRVKWKPSCASFSQEPLRLVHGLGFLGCFSFPKPGDSFLEIAEGSHVPAVKAAQEREEAGAMMRIGRVQHSQALLFSESDFVEGADEPGKIPGSRIPAWDPDEKPERRVEHGPLRAFGKPSQVRPKSPCSPSSLCGPSPPA